MIAVSGHILVKSQKLCLLFWERTGGWEGYFLCLWHFAHLWYLLYKKIFSQSFCSWDVLKISLLLAPFLISVSYTLSLNFIHTKKRFKYCDQYFPALNKYIAGKFVLNTVYDIYSENHHWGLQKQNSSWLHKSLYYS